MWFLIIWILIGFIWANYLEWRWEKREDNVYKKWSSGERLAVAWLQILIWPLFLTKYIMGVISSRGKDW